MPVVPLPRDSRFFYMPEYIALAEALFGKDRDTWMFCCAHCKKTFTKAEADAHWLKVEGRKYKSASICHLCLAVVKGSKVPGSNGDPYYQVLAMPKDFPNRTDVPPEGSMLFAMPFFHEHASARELVLAVKPWYEVAVPIGKFTKPKPAGFDLGAPPAPPPPPAPKPKGGAGYGFKF